MQIYIFIFLVKKYIFLYFMPKKIYFYIFYLKNIYFYIFRLLKYIFCTEFSQLPTPRQHVSIFFCVFKKLNLIYLFVLLVVNI